jgi:hypothetical protein
VNDDRVKVGKDFWPEKTVCLIGDVADSISIDRGGIVRLYFQAIDPFLIVSPFSLTQFLRLSR